MLGLLPNSRSSPQQQVTWIDLVSLENKHQNSDVFLFCVDSA